MSGRHHYNQADLEAALCQAGLAAGDVVLVHLGMLKLGIPQEVHQGSSPFQVILAALRAVLGPRGTLLTPTFSYSFCKNEVFDPQETPSTVGAFGENFRRLPGVTRSLEPIFSVAGEGPLVPSLFADLPRDCFGEDCFFDRLARAGGKVLVLGVNLFFCTAMHHLEQRLGVPHRYRKLFPGTLLRDGQWVKEDWVYFVRTLDEYSNPAFDRLQAPALERGIARQATVGLGSLVLVGLADLYAMSEELLAQDPWATAQGPPCDPLAAERLRVPSRLPAVDLPAPASMEQLARGLGGQPRPLVSDGVERALEALALQMPLKLHAFASGSASGQRLVPERWSPRAARLETLAGRVVLSLEDHPLRLMAYSQPLAGVVDRATLLEHLHACPQDPGLIPWLSRPFTRDWGLCCTQAERQALEQDLEQDLEKDQYRVSIEVDFSYDQLKVGEVTAPGKSPDCYLLCARLAPPYAGEDGPTGVAVGVEVLRRLLARPGRRHAYRLLILPEDLGLDCYLAALDPAGPAMRGALLLERLGCSDPHALRAWPGPAGGWQPAISQALAELDPAASTTPPQEALDDDYRQFQLAGQTMPLALLCRAQPPRPGQAWPAPRGARPSGAAGPESLDPAALEASRDLILRAIDLLENY